MADDKNNPMTGLMDRIQGSFERGGLKTTRDGNQVNVVGTSKGQKPQASSVEKGPSKQSMQEAEDARMRRLEDAAPTTKTEMGKSYKKGGAVKARGCGCAQRGLTKGKMR